MKLKLLLLIFLNLIFKIEVNSQIKDSINFIPNFDTIQDSVIVTFKVKNYQNILSAAFYLQYDYVTLEYGRAEFKEDQTLGFLTSDCNITTRPKSLELRHYSPNRLITLPDDKEFVKVYFYIKKNPFYSCINLFGHCVDSVSQLVPIKFDPTCNIFSNDTCYFYPETELKGDTVLFHIKTDNFRNIYSYSRLRYSYDASSLKFIDAIPLPYNNVRFLISDYYAKENIIKGINNIEFGWNSKRDPLVSSMPNGSDIFIFKFLVLDNTKPICLTSIDSINREVENFWMVNKFGRDWLPYKLISGCRALNDTPTVFGKVLQDELTNCKLDNESIIVPQVVVEFINGNKRYTTLSDSKGEFSKYLPIGTYLVKTTPTNNLWKACNNTGSITVTGIKDSIRITELVQEAKKCPELHVVIHNNRLRPCNQSHYTVDYNNQGTEDATNAYVDVGIDLLINLINASIPYQNIGNGYYRFNLGTIKVGQSGRFTITVDVPCDASLLGRTACCNAHIYPDENCNTTGNARLEISAQCKNNIANFVVTNNGTADMLSELSFSTIEDDVMPGIQGKVKLKINESQIIDLPANGKTIRILFDTIRNHPYNVQYSKAVEACGTRNDGKQSLGFINNFPLGDDEPFYDEECIEIRNSYDPNDKTASPEGYTQSNYIPYDSRIKYTINFQNTGNDTAYSVRIDDKISTLFDLQTLEIYSASHPMTWNIAKDRTLSFLFKPIALVDSFTNEPTSKGYVTYSIVPIQPLEPGTIINNSADIFFDFNPPIRTNTYQHTLWNKIITLISNPSNSDVNCKIYPNPFSDQIIFELNEKYSLIKLQITDIFGKQIVSTSSNSNQIILNDENSLVSGTYFFKILDSNNIILKTGKIIKL